MKIAFDISSLDSDSRFRGIGSYTQNLSQALKKINKPNFHFFTFKSSKTIPQADLYHFPAFNPFNLSFPLKLLTHSIITIHDLIPLDFREHFPVGVKANLIWRLQKSLLNKSQHIITDSQASQKSIIRHSALPSNKITPIPLAVDPIFKKQKAKKTSDLPAKFVLYVGDFNWNKNALSLAKACVDLRIPLVVVGKQATNMQIDRQHPWNLALVSFQNYATKHLDLITCLGYIKTAKLVDLYNQATIFCCPSYAEGFGLPLLEALSCGTPSLASNQTSLLEVGEDACLSFDPYQKNDLKQKLKKIWQDPKLRSKLSAKALLQTQNFSWQKTAQKTYKIYEKIYDQR